VAASSALVEASAALSHSRQLFVSAQVGRVVGTPMSCHHRGITLLIGGEWARRAHHREWPHAETCGGKTARSRFWRPTSFGPPLRRARPQRLGKRSRRSA